MVNRFLFLILLSLCAQAHAQIDSSPPVLYMSVQWGPSDSMLGLDYAGESKIDESNSVFPREFVVDKNGIMYFLDCVNNAVKMFQAPNRFLRKIGSLAELPLRDCFADLMLDSIGNVYVMDRMRGPNRLVKFDRNGGLVYQKHFSVFHATFALYGMNVVVFDESEPLFDKILGIISPSGEEISRDSALAQGILGVSNAIKYYQIALDNRGRIYTENAGLLGAFLNRDRNPKAARAIEFPSFLRNPPQCVGYDSKYGSYWSVRQTKEGPAFLLKFDSNGALGRVRKITRPSGSLDLDMFAVDAQGNVYQRCIFEHEGIKVYKYDMN